ncbi:MAG: DUF108 domain-containing protein, partial [Candidatus Omnitrophica bacterium]|nr:DUF108 domain-containing protein [Candidatus Omnitrophota bacterium]
PKNVNVSSILSLAGLGAESTTVRIVASPGCKSNIHEVEIVADSGRITTRTENVPFPANPRTSWLAILSAIAALKNAVESVKLGT